MSKLFSNYGATALAAVALLFLGAVSGGCQSSRATRLALARKQATTMPAGLKAWPDVQAMVAVPDGWKPDPLKKSEKHTHQVWISPSGNTAYGVIHFTLPLALSAEFVLPFFMSEMRRTEGEATLLSRQSDEALPGVRFEAEGGEYRLSVNLITSGSEGWAIYAGVLRDKAVNVAELALAKEAREITRVGIPDEFAGH